MMRFAFPIACVSAMLAFQGCDNSSPSATATRDAGATITPASNTTVLTLKVEGMTCGGCENSVKTALARIDGVKACTASHTEKVVTVTTDDPAIQAKVVDAIEALNFKVQETEGS